MTQKKKKNSGLKSATIFKIWIRKKKTLPKICLDFLSFFSKKNRKNQYEMGTREKEKKKRCP